MEKHLLGVADLSNFFHAQDETARWRAESERASARLDIARMKQSMALLISQFEPLESIGLDRDKLRVIFSYIGHGDLGRLARDIQTLNVTEIAADNATMVPAENFCGTLSANVDNEKLSDADFRQIVRNTLPIVIFNRTTTGRSDSTKPNESNVPKSRSDS
jgi:hypothetical protein